jgi:hypothetical protein
MRLWRRLHKKVHGKWRLIDTLRPPNALNKSGRPPRSYKPSSNSKQR